LIPYALTEERGDRAHEVAAIDMSDEVDDVAADLANTAIPKISVDIDCEAIISAANQAWSDQVVAALSPELATAASDLALNPYGACAVDFRGSNYSFFLLP
jgi:hypothetical protein